LSSTHSLDNDSNAEEIDMIDLGSYNAMPATPSRSEMAVQTTLSTNDVSALEDFVQLQNQHYTHARLALERICPGETTLGLTTSSGDVKLILDALLDRLHVLSTQFRASESALNISRTQESNMRNQFNAALKQIENIRSQGKELNAAYKIISDKYANAKTRIAAFESTIDERDRSITKLQKALETYRAEVKSLESLITRLDSEHQASLATLKSEMGATVSDLEAAAAAETRGRREAEAVSDQHLLRVAQLQGSEKELKAAIAEKQALVRSLEEALSAERTTREVEVGHLNTRISSVSEQLSAARSDLATAEQERLRLADRVREERQAGLVAVAKMKDEVEKAVERAEVIRSQHCEQAKARGAEVVEQRGLLTPVDAVRFRDASQDDRERIEGHVEIKRGRKTRSKRGIDSGVCLMEEDENAYDVTTQI
jgi:chromosome segregation ATPase